MSYVQLTREERYVIAQLRLRKVGVREIARYIKRHHSTISRELTTQLLSVRWRGIRLPRRPRPRRRTPCQTPASESASF